MDDRTALLLDLCEKFRKGVRRERLHQSRPKSHWRDPIHVTYTVSRNRGTRAPAAWDVVGYESERFRELTRVAALTIAIPDGPDAWCRWLEAVRRGLHDQGKKLPQWGKTVTRKDDNVLSVERIFILKDPWGACAHYCHVLASRGVSTGDASDVTTSNQKTSIKDRVPEFLENVLRSTGEKVTRTDIALVAGYTSYDAYRKVQRAKAGAAAIRNFKSAIAMNPDKFVAALRVRKARLAQRRKRM